MLQKINLTSKQTCHYYWKVNIFPMTLRPHFTSLLYAISIHFICWSYYSDVTSYYVINHFALTKLIHLWTDIQLPHVLKPLYLFIPCASTSFAIFKASELARSVFAGLTAKMRQLSLEINSMSMARICCSISAGWSPTGTLVIPGKSIRVKFNTEITQKEINWEKRSSNLHKQN